MLISCQNGSTVGDDLLSGEMAKLSADNDLSREIPPDVCGIIAGYLITMNAFGTCASLSRVSRPVHWEIAPHLFRIVDWNLKLTRCFYSTTQQGREASERWQVKLNRWLLECPSFDGARYLQYLMFPGRNDLDIRDIGRLAVQIPSLKAATSSTTTRDIKRGKRIKDIGITVCSGFQFGTSDRRDAISRLTWPPLEQSFACCIRPGAWQVKHPLQRAAINLSLAGRSTQTQGDYYDTLIADVMYMFDLSMSVNSRGIEFGEDCEKSRLILRDCDFVQANAFVNNYIDAIICNKFYATVAVTIICKQYDEPGLSDLRNVLDIVFGKIRQAIRGVGTQHIGSITVGYPLNGKITEWGSIRPGWPTPEGKLEFFALEMRDGSMKDL